MRLDRIFAVGIVFALAFCGSLSLAQDQPPSADGPQLRESPPAGEAPAATGQEGQPQTPGEQPAQPTQRPPGGLFGGTMTMPIILLVGLAAMFWWSGRSRRKRETKRQEMLASLSKGDKVTSIGGVVGTIVEVREDEVVVKVDETNNVRMRFARWAVRGVGDEAKREPEKK